VACPGHWYLTGAYVDSNGGTRPAAWQSTDGRTFTPMATDPNTYYGRMNTLYAAGCLDGRLAALGNKAGGVHGFPRTSNWYEDAGGVMRQIEAVYTLYGGPDGVNVSRIVGAPKGSQAKGWIETGNRVKGATAWLSDDAARWRIVEGAPSLGSDASARTWASDVVATPSGWMIVGSVTAAGSADGQPAVWPSADGVTWHRVDVPGVPGYEEIQRATSTGADVVGVGVQGGGFGVWRGSAGGQGWRQIGSFGSNGGAGQGFTAGVTEVRGRLFTAVSNGRVYSLWRSADKGAHWLPVEMPADSPSRANANTTLLGDSGRILLIVDDGHASVIWAANAPESG
jgi:hypothetical protein